VVHIVLALREGANHRAGVLVVQRLAVVVCLGWARGAGGSGTTGNFKLRIEAIGVEVWMINTMKLTV